MPQPHAPKTGSRPAEEKTAASKGTHLKEGKLSSHEQQVNQRNYGPQTADAEGYTGVPPGEEGQYGMRRDDADAEGEANPAQEKLPLNPANSPAPRKKAEQKNEGDKDARLRDNPYDDKRYEADFDHAGYGGPGVGSDKA